MKLKKGDVLYREGDTHNRMLKAVVHRVSKSYAYLRIPDENSTFEVKVKVKPSSKYSKTYSGSVKVFGTPMKDIWKLESDELKKEYLLSAISVLIDWNYTSLSYSSLRDKSFNDLQKFVEGLVNFGFLSRRDFN